MAGFLENRSTTVSPIQVRYFREQEDAPYLFFVRFTAISLTVPAIAHELGLGALLAHLTRNSTPTSEICLAVRSRYPFHGLFEGFFRWMLEAERVSRLAIFPAIDQHLTSPKSPLLDLPLWPDAHRQHFEATIISSFKAPPPGTGQRFQIDQLPFPEFAWTRPSTPKPWHPLAVHVLPELVRFVKRELFPTLFTAVLLEKTVIVYHTDDRVVSNIIMALHFLLKPLRWASSSISLLPACLDDLLNAPNPFLIGSIRPQQLQPESVYADLVKGDIRVADGPLPVYSPMVELPRLFRSCWDPAKDLTPVLTECHKIVEALIAPVVRSIMTDFSDRTQAKSSFYRELYLKHFPLSERAFLQALCETQTFQMHLEQECRKKSEDKMV
jgi:hypothetical protein